MMALSIRIALSTTSQRAKGFQESRSVGQLPDEHAHMRTRRHGGRGGDSFVPRRICLAVFRAGIGLHDVAVAVAGGMSADHDIAIYRHFHAARPHAKRSSPPWPYS